MALTPISKIKLESLLDEAKGCTLGDIDKKNKKLFDAPTAKTNKGIAGDVIEISLLGFEKNSDQLPDMILDGVETELKTTGIIIKKDGRKKNAPMIVVPKEPISVTSTGVSKKNPFEILEISDFNKSHIWAKSEHIVFAYYFYDKTKKTSKKFDMTQYANFIFQDYQYYDMNEAEKEMIKNDWKVVYDFVKNVKDNNLDYKKEYLKIGKLRNNMLCMDTAPSWKKGTPRFRFNKEFSKSIVQQKFSAPEKVVKASREFYSMESLNKILIDFTNKYKNKSVQYILDDLDIIMDKVDKKIIERILAKAFGADSNKLRKLNTFQKTNIIPKTVILKSSGKPTEDMKLDKISFNDEFGNDKYVFEDSELFSSIIDYRFLIPVFKEPRKQEQGKKIPLAEDIFIGFKIVYFDTDEIISTAEKVWNIVQDLVVNKKLKIEKIWKKDGSPYLNKNGIQLESPNFPKSKDFDVFLRGTGSNSKHKTLVVNNLKMYQQNFWLKRTKVIEILNEADYIE